MVFIPGIVSRAASPILRRVWFSVTYNRLTANRHRGRGTNETDAQAFYLEHLGSGSRQ
jgi:hypothetical protein